MFLLFCGLGVGFAVARGRAASACKMREDPAAAFCVTKRTWTWVEWLVDLDSPAEWLVDLASSITVSLSFSFWLFSCLFSFSFLNFRDFSFD